MLVLLVESGGLFNRVELAIDADAGEAGLLPLRQLLAILALAAAYDRREEVEARALRQLHHAVDHLAHRLRCDGEAGGGGVRNADARPEEARSEEHTSELQSLMRISYAVFCLKKNIKNTHP